MARARQVFVDGKWVDAPGYAPEPDTTGVDVREDGTLRRSGKGGRPASIFFSEESKDRSMARGDYLAARASEEYARRERLWYRRLWRWLTHRPPVVDINVALADAHARTLEELFQALKAKAEEKAEEKANG